MSRCFSGAARLLKPRQAPGQGKAQIKIGMKSLIELVGLLTRYKKKQIEVLGEKKGTGSRYDTFYEIVASGEVTTDDEAARFFFGEDKDGSYVQYRNLRNNFFRRLVNTAFFIDLKKPMFNDAQAAVHHVRKQAAAARIVGSRGAVRSAMEIAEKTIKPAVAYELTYEVLDLARLLRHKYTFMVPNEGKRAKYERLIECSLSDLAHIAKAEQMYYKLIAPYIKSKGHKPWMNKKARQFLLELEGGRAECKAHYFQVLYYSIAELECMTRHDYRSAIAVCRRALAFLETRKATTPPMKAAFLQTIVAAATMLRWYGEAEKAAEESRGLTLPGTLNWYKGLEQGIYLHLHQKQYQKAYELYAAARQHQRFCHLPPATAEAWRILEAYIGLLRAAGKITAPVGNGDCPRLMPAKLLNEVPIFSKDKRGLNIPVLIVHIIMLLQLGRYDEAYARMQALDKYAGRHLQSGDDTFRSFCFIKALLCIHYAGYKKEAAQSAAAELLAQMSESPLQLVQAPHEIEVMPYEHLWDMAMDIISA